MSGDGVRPVVIYVAPCPHCKVDVPWHSRQFEQPMPKCKRPTCRAREVVEK